MTSYRTETETVSQTEKAVPLDCCCIRQSVASPSLCLCHGSQWTFQHIFIVQCVKLLMSKFMYLCFLPCDTMVHKRGLCRLVRCLSVRHVRVLYISKPVIVIILKLFSRSDSHTILVFPHQTLGQHSDGYIPPNWGKNRDFRPIFGSTLCSKKHVTTFLMVS